MKKIVLLFLISLWTITVHSQTYGARTDITPQAYPSPIPCPFSAGSCAAGNGQAGGTQAGYCFTPTDFATVICRLTDKNFYPGAANANQRSFQTDCGGSGEANVMDSSNTRFYVCDGGSAINIGSFNPGVSPPTFGELYGSYLLPGCSTFSTFTQNLFFSFTQAKVAYAEDYTAAGSPAICQYDFTSGVTGPTVGNGKITVLLDLSTCVGALSGIGVVAVDDVTVSADDQWFAALGSTTLGQGSSGAIYVILWNRTTGCRVLNTSTATVSGAGVTGALSLTDEYTIHNVRLSKSGNWVRITPTTCLNAACSAHNVNSYQWHIPDLNAYAAVNDATNGGGHLVLGYSNWVNQVNSGTCGTDFLIRSNTSNDASGTHIQPSCPSPVTQNGSHLSWNNGNSSDTSPVMVSMETGPPFAISNTWDSEIVGLPTSSPGTLGIYRFAHNYSTYANAESFNAAHAVGTPSQDGKYYFWSTDWDGMLGNLDGATSACTISVDCRPDVFVAVLPLTTSTFILAPQVIIKANTIVQ